MCPLGYYTLLRQSKDPTYLRFEIVRYAREHGIKAAARHFATTIKTVRKWLRRWQPGSLQGLKIAACAKASGQGLTRKSASAPSIKSNCHRGALKESA